MTIASGTRLGPYEIVAPIGAGGMGEVYKARDTRLDREVAVKILPAEFAQNAHLKTKASRAVIDAPHPALRATLSPLTRGEERWWREAFSPLAGRRCPKGG